MTLVVRGSGRSSGPTSRGSAAVAWFFIRRYVERALFTATTCIHVVNRPRPPQLSILAAIVDQRVLAGVLGVGKVRQHAAADVERARPDRREQRLQRVAVTVLRAPGELVDLVRRQCVPHAITLPRCLHSSQAPGKGDRTVT